MPIYEYYCPKCEGRFRHLTRAFDTPPPVCPACGSSEVEKLISAAHVGRSLSQRQEAFERNARDVAGADLQTAAQALQEGGELLDQVTPQGMDRETFREIVQRRAEGATDADLEDIVEGMPLPEPPEEMLHPHEHTHDHEHAHSRRHARDLGWG
ncbi:MAG: hypothetical protein JXB35_14155 [Anaerolineae bacterium]|nr:hypothetical protein [Anaerolineae bacterium]